MEYTKHLIQEARTGKTKELTILVEDGSNLIQRTHGLTGHKFVTHNPKEVKGKNIGKANETSPHEQAVQEATALYDRKIRDGYDDFTVSTDTPAQTPQFPEEVFYPLPTNYAPSKPIVHFPEDEDPADYFWERKNDGVNLWLLTGKDGDLHDYTRGVKEITKIIAHLPLIQELQNHAIYPPKSKISYELIHYNKDGVEVTEDLRGILNDRTTRDKSKARYDKLVEAGSTFAIRVFDVMFWDGMDLCKHDYAVRRGMLTAHFSEYMSEFGVSATQDVIDAAEAKGWEGLILRKLVGPESHIEYTLNGKPYRRGAWKYVFNKNDDFVVYEYMLGDSGRIKDLPARFHLGQYDDDGNIVEICWAGPGKFTTEALEELAQTLPHAAEYKVATPCDHFVVEVEYKQKQIGSNALKMPVIQRLRFDKPKEECIFVE